MKITLFPFLGYEEYTAFVHGDVITINGEELDFSPLSDGYRLLGIDSGNKFIVPTTYIERVNGEIALTLFLNVHENTDKQWRDPVTPNVLYVNDGKVPLPDTSPVVEDVIDVPPIVINLEDLQSDQMV